MKTIALTLTLSALLFTACGDSGSSSGSTPSTPTVRNQNDGDATLTTLTLEVDGGKIDILNSETPYALEKTPGIKILEASEPDENTVNLTLRLTYPKEVNLIVSASGNNRWAYKTQYNVRRSTLPNHSYTQDGSDSGSHASLQKINIIPLDEEHVIGGNAEFVLTMLQGKNTLLTFNLTLLF